MRAELSGRVVFLGELEAVEDIFRQVDIFFSISQLDPMPNVAIEAMFMNIPMICFDRASGIAEILRRSAETARCVIPYGDVAAATEEIVTRLSDEPLRRFVGDAAGRLANATFRMPDYVAALDELGCRPAERARAK